MMTLLGVSTRQVAFLVGLGVIAAAFEAVGVSVLVPLLGYVERGPRVFEESRLAAAAARAIAPLGIAPSLAVLFLAALVPMLGRQMFRYLRQVYGGRIRLAAIARLRREGIAALLDADLAFVLGRGYARLTGTLTTEVERCAAALPMFLQLIESSLLIGVYLVLLLVIAAPLVPIVAAAMLVAALIIRSKIRRAERWGQQVAWQGRALQVGITERLVGFRLIKLRGREAQESAYLGRLADDLSQRVTDIARMKEALQASIEPIMVAGVLAALYLAITVSGTGLAVIGVFGLIVTRLVPLLQQANDARLGLAALIAGLQEIASQTEAARATVKPVHAGIPFPGLRREVTFENVSFRYDDEEHPWALRDVSFTATRGSLTAIVGRSGAGKSTLLDLVPRLRDATSGSICIDGVPLERFDLTSLRRGIGFVDQEGFLFDGTIAENIAYGVPDVSAEAIATAARRAHAAEFIERLPEGYLTRVGTEGHRLSVGQRQRVSIARTLLQDPDILLLDEPTSALDGESEQQIRAVLDEVRPRKAVLVVAHRLSTIRSADQIIVLERGQIIERGSHDALLAKVGTYHQLFDVQVNS
jgi:ABC-type multidrug transport system fused ATPase/permease subunit